MDQSGKSFAQWTSQNRVLVQMTLLYKVDQATLSDTETERLHAVC